ncbi:MAG TPA: phage baseplate assembly protein V [Acidimicrobiales bacterium]
MTTGYGGTYRGVVIDDADPLGQMRLKVRVPEVFGEDVDMWARASRSGGSTPAVGDLVWVSFEHGDSDYPVWENEGADDRGPDRGFVGKFHGVVVSNDDPMGERRLEVTVPEVLGDAWAWAAASSEVSDVDLPEVGTSVWIEFEEGDPAYPRWVGLE